MWRWWVGNARMLVLKLITRGLGWGLPEPVLPWEGVPPPPRPRRQRTRRKAPGRGGARFWKGPEEEIKPQPKT